MPQLGGTEISVSGGIKVDDIAHDIAISSKLRVFLEIKVYLYYKQPPIAFKHATPLFLKHLKCTLPSAQDTVYFPVSCLSFPACLLEAAGWLSAVTVPICHLYMRA